MSATLEAIRPTRLDIIDLPRDPERCLGGLRAGLCSTFNYVKRYPTKLATFIEVLEYVLERAKELSTGAVEAALEAQAAAAKAAAELAEAEELAERKAKIAAEVIVMKDAAKAIIVTAQEITVLEDLKEFVLTEGFEITGETLEEICTAFVKDKTAAVLAQVAEFKATQE